MKVTFFNYYHNGDVHLSRGFVRQIMSHLKSKEPQTTFAYSHRNSPNILADIDGLAYEPHSWRNIRENDNAIRMGDNIYINTWYAQQFRKYMNQYGITIDCLYAAFDNTCKEVWKFALSDISSEPSSFFPSIDYSKFHIQHASSWLSNHPEKKILVSNGAALSGQATNFAMTPLILELAKRHIDKTFILCNKEMPSNLPSNVVYSADIIQKQAFDLNENAFLSEHCDVIIGRASGAFAFAQTQNNMFKRRCKFLCFSNLVPAKEGKFWLSTLLQDKVQYSADIIVSNESNVANIQKIIECHL